MMDCEELEKGNAKNFNDKIYNFELNLIFCHHCTGDHIKNLK